MSSSKINLFFQTMVRQFDDLSVVLEHTGRQLKYLHIGETPKKMNLTS